MANEYYFKSGGSAVIPVADASFEIDGVSLDYNQHELEIRFWDSSDADTLATPGAGTLTVQYSMGGGTASGGVDVWRNFADGVAVDATAVHDATWTPPSSLGSSAKYKLTLAGVTTATHFTAWVVAK